MNNLDGQDNVYGNERYATLNIMYVHKLYMLHLKICFHKLRLLC